MSRQCAAVKEDQFMNGQVRTITVIVALVLAIGRFDGPKKLLCQGDIGYEEKKAERPASFDDTAVLLEKVK